MESSLLTFKGRSTNSLDMVFLNSDIYIMIHNTNTLKHHAKSSLEVYEI